MPAELDRCVAHVMSRPDFEPQAGRTPEESAFAICRVSLGLKDDGSEDHRPMEMPDEMLSIRVGNEIARRRFDNGPVLRKPMVVAKPIGRFKNGDTTGILDAKVISELASNFQHKTQVPIFLWDHVSNLDERPPDGWVESVRVNENGELVAETKLHGEAVALIVGDRIRQASIAWKPKALDYQGRPIGAVLQHVTLTNNPYIKDLPNIAAARDKGGEPLLVCLTALPSMEAAMAQDEKDKKIAKLEEEIAAMKAQSPDEKAAAQIKEQEQKIVELKAESLRKGEENEALKEQLANAKADVDKEQALVENVNLKRKDFLRDVRAIVEYGLHKGTLLASECDGYAGTGPLDFTATERWLKGSKFYDAARPNPEQFAFGVIEYMALKTKPRVNIGARFNSGTPKQDNGQLTLTQEQKDGIRKLGLDPEMVAAMTDNTTFEERQALKAQKGS